MSHVTVLRTSGFVEQWTLLIKNSPVSVGAERSHRSRLRSGVVRRDICSALTGYKSRERRQLLEHLLLRQVSAAKLM
jgi:hypothetical protein